MDRSWSVRIARGSSVVNRGELYRGCEANGWVLQEKLFGFGPCQSWKARNGFARQTAELRIRDLEQIPESMVSREVDLLSQLQAQWFSPLLGHFAWDRYYLLACQWKDGCTLADLLEANPSGLPPAIAEDIARSLLLALENLHNLPGQPVHRALSPAHLWIDADFALSLGGLTFVEPFEDLPYSPTLYHSFGDPRYQAPEVFGDPSLCSPLSNVYSAALIVYEIYTGRRAFDSYEPNSNDWQEDIAYQQLNLPAPLVSYYAPLTPQHITDAVERALDKDPMGRPDSCMALATQLAGEGG